MRYYLNRLGINSPFTYAMVICNILLTTLWFFGASEPLHNVLGVLYLLWWVAFAVGAYHNWKKTVNVS